MSFSTLEKVGLVSLVIFGYVFVNKFCWYVYRNFLGPRARRIDFKGLGKWALVTGSTDGVGKAYAKALAKKGCDIILVSRTESKLEAVAAEIKSEYNVETKCIVADFTETEGVYDHIEKQLTGLEIGILINNVGLSFSYPEYFLEVPDKEILYERIIKANVVAVTRMCGIVMPGMVERRRGLVINLSSAAALMPAPLFAVYAASKMYVDKLTEDLASSYSRHGLIIQSVLPGPVATKMSKIYRATWMAPSPDDFVKSALNTCGKSDATTGYHPHDLLVGAVKGISAICPAAAVWLVTKTTENIRRRALKKISSSSL